MKTSGILHVTFILQLNAYYLYFYKNTFAKRKVRNEILSNIPEG